MAEARTTPQLVRLSDYRAPAFQVPDIALAFDLDAERTLVTAEMTVERVGEHDEPLLLDGEGLELLSVAVDGRLLGAGDYRYEDDRLTIPGIGARAVIRTEVAIRPAANSELMGLYSSGGKLCTQCEAEGFRRITFFPDRPDVLSRFRVRLNADKARYPVLLSNGNPVGEGELEGGRHWAEWDDPYPKPCYLFALVAGQLSPLRDSFTTRSGRTVDLAIWVDAEDLPRCAHAMAALKASMLWDEEVYGREYDLDVFNIVAVPDFNFGAMENKGLNIFNSKYILADPETATDADFDAVAAVVAHEYFHNWTGNRVTCRDWFQLSLKEGLTVYRDQQFSADQGSPAVKRIEDVRGLRAVQFQEDSGPLAHPVRPDSYIEISNFYTATVYNKGAEVIRMMATLLGPERYRRGMDLYFERHDGQAVTVEDFVRAMEDAGGVDLGQFRRWYAQAGTPRVEARIAFDAGKKQARLTLGQQLPPTPGQPDKEPMHIPLKLALFGRTSGRKLGDDRLIELRESEEVVVLDDVPEEPVLSVLRGFSAPVSIASPSKRADLAFLAAHDDDPFARYEAIQRLALDVLMTNIASGEDAGQEELARVIGATLDADLDPALIAEAVLLPSESFIGDQMALVDVAGIHEAREQARRTIGRLLRDRWWAVYEANRANRYELNPEAKGRRRLRNVALGYLMADEDQAGVAAACGQFDEADNMTDRIAAVSLLASAATAEQERARVLGHFYDRYRGNALVIDKWFTIQALSTRADTPQRVMELAAHPDFSLTNPNRLRALVGAFANNQPRFHDASGAGYRFVADQVLKADEINPQSAARLAAPLGRWKRFDAKRGKLMRAELERILARPGLSKDVYEIASKSLNQ